MADGEVIERPTDLSPEPEQVIEKADESMQASLEEEEKEEKEVGEMEEEKEEEGQNRGKNLHCVSTEMDNIVL